MRLGRLATFLVIFAIAAWPPPALGQDLAAAEALFQRGLEELKAENYEKACATLKESHRLDPRPGVLFTWATCEARAGRVATARSLYQDFLDMVKALPANQKRAQKDREKVAREERDRLAKMVPKLTLHLPSTAPPGTVVRRNGVELGGASIGIALPVDPGEHTIETQAPGGEVFKEKVIVGVGEDKTLALTVLKPSAEPDGATEAGSQPAGASPSAGALPPDEPTSHLPWSVSTLVVGVATVGVGATMGGLSIARKGTADEECDGTFCTAAGLEAVDEGKTFGTVSTVLIPIGAAFLVTSIVLFVTEPSSPNVAARSRVRGARPFVTPRGAGLRF